MILKFTILACIYDILIQVPVLIFEKKISECSKIVRNAAGGIFRDIADSVGNFNRN